MMLKSAGNNLINVYISVNIITVMPEKYEKTGIIGIIPKYPCHSQQNVFSKIRMPPVGIISVLSQINKNSQFNDIYAIDENNYSGPLDSNGMPDHFFLQNKEPAKIAMFYGGMSNSIPRMFSLAKQYKKFGALTITGGSHVDALPKEALDSGIDIVVHGEGEETIKEIMGNSEEIVEKKNKNLENILGISFINDNGKYVFTGKRNSIKNLDCLNDPDLSLIRFLEKKISIIPISRSRGCNFKCDFCVVNEQYGKFKKISNEKSLNQIRKHYDLGFSNFFFTCDNFAQDIPSTIELCRMIGDDNKDFRRKIKKFTVQVRSDVADNPELINSMKYAGINTLCIGYESPINEELKAMKKGVTVEKLIERSKKLSKHFYLHGMFIFGYPSFEDSKHKSNLTLKEKEKRYSEFFKKAKIDTLQVFNAVPLPGSSLRLKLEKEGRIPPLNKINWDKYDGQFLCYDSTPEGINPRELENIPKRLMKKWYLGGFINNNLNYGNWINWVYNASIGFPIQFTSSYAKKFFNNLLARQDLASTLTKENIFYNSLKEAMKDIKKTWRNLAIKTYGGRIIKRWDDEYLKFSHEKPR